MPDKEKCIKGLEICVGRVPGKYDCYDCPYEIDGNYCEINLAKDALFLLKEQEAKTGHWIDSAGNDKCSICGEEYSDLYPDYGNTHFCPNCGAKMEGR